MASRLPLLALTAALALIAVPAAAQAKAPVASSGNPASCPAADSAAAHLEKGELSKARDAYLDALASEPGCATKGLNQTTATARAEARLCAEAEVLSKGKQDAAARQRYVAALNLNTESECATKGLAPPKTKSASAKVKDWRSFATDSLALIGSVLLAVFLVIGFGLLIWAAVKRLRTPSLTVEAFADEAAEPKVGGAVAALIEKQLIDLSRRSGHPSDGYQLDLVIADVELLASDEKLATAVEDLADVSQLKVVAAVLSMVDRLFGKRSLVAKGELMPAGEKGSGVALALYRHNGLQSRQALWDPASAPPAPPLPTPAPPPAPPPPPPGPGGAAEEEPKPSPDSFYRLAIPAASWVQYEAARSLDSHVGKLTENARSWEQMAAGLALQRAGSVRRASEAYADALATDPDNVAALINLSLLLAREYGRYPEAIGLLIRARNVLRNRYDEELR